MFKTIILNVTQDHIDNGYIGSGTDPVTLALQEQVGPTWRWLGGNDIRDMSKGLAQQSIVRVPPSSDERYLNNIMKSWFPNYHGEILQPFQISFLIQEENNMAFVDVAFQVLSGELTAVLQSLPVVQAPAPTTLSVVLLVTNDTTSDVSLTFTMTKSGDQAAKLTLPLPQNVTIPANSVNYEITFVIQVIETFHKTDNATLRIVGV